MADNFTPLPETARAIVHEQGALTLHAVIAEYAVNGAAGPPAAARLNTALPGIRQDAQATLEVGWPDVVDEGGLSTLWSNWAAGAIYTLGALDYPTEDHVDDELARANEIVALAHDHTGARNAAQGALAALRARQNAHPDDPCDPAREGTAGASGQGGGPP